MCGIMGYIGKQEAAPILIDGLARLEYRGYDSAGVTIYEQGKLKSCKTVGRLRKVEELLAVNPIRGQAGIGHTRWATHGRPSDRNAHPHFDCNRKFSVVHNGIIENYLELREWLQEKGAYFQLRNRHRGLTALDRGVLSGRPAGGGARSPDRRWRGLRSRAICADRPGQLVVARKASPLIVGLGRG